MDTYEKQLNKVTIHKFSPIFYGYKTIITKNGLTI